MPTPAAPPSIRIAGMHRFPSGWSWSFGAHPLPWTGSLFGTVLDGTLRLTDERHVGRDQVLTTGMTYWLPLPHLLFRLENAGRHPLTVAWFNWDVTAPAADHATVRSVTSPWFWRELVHRTVESVQRRQQPAATIWTSALWQELNAAGPIQELVVDETRERHTEAMQDLARRIRLHPERPWKTSGMARELGLSIPQFTRVFRCCMGHAPREFVEQCRIEAVKGFLLTTTQPILRIAELTGFPDQFALSRTFRRIAGRSPSSFRAAAGDPAGG